MQVLPYINQYTCGTDSSPGVCLHASLLWANSCYRQHISDIVGTNLQGCLIIALNGIQKVAKDSNVLAEGTQLLLLYNMSDPVVKVPLRQ